LIISINTISVDPPSAPKIVGYRYALPNTPITTANARERATQIIAIPLDLFNSF
jgi:hypothetical protein